MRAHKLVIRALRLVTEANRVAIQQHVLLNVSTICYIGTKTTKSGKDANSSSGRPIPRLDTVSYQLISKDSGKAQRD
jgi:hypothetical protein